jgi:hypothetical protein
VRSPIPGRSIYCQIIHQILAWISLCELCRFWGIKLTLCGSTSFTISSNFRMSIECLCYEWRHLHCTFLWESIFYTPNGVQKFLLKRQCQQWPLIPPAVRRRAVFAKAAKSYLCCFQWLLWIRDRIVQSFISVGSTFHSSVLMMETLCSYLELWLKVNNMFNIITVQYAN